MIVSVEHALLATEIFGLMAFSLISWYYAVCMHVCFLEKTKVVGIQIVFGCSSISVIPSKICVRACWKSLLPSAEAHRTVLSLISCFAGGVFLSACLLDIIPDYLSDINTELNARKLEVCRRRHRFGWSWSWSFVQNPASTASVWDLGSEHSSSYGMCCDPWYGIISFCWSQTDQFPSSRVHHGCRLLYSPHPREDRSEL